VQRSERVTVAAALYYLTIAAVLLIGLLAGRRARSIIHAGLIGLIGNLIMVATLFLATIAFAILAPGSIDSSDMGFRLGALLLFGSAVGVVAAIGGRRHAVKMATRLF
jgi:uncharacterized membrane protein YkgB